MMLQAWSTLLPLTPQVEPGGGEAVKEPCGALRQPEVVDEAHGGAR